MNMKRTIIITIAAIFCISLVLPAGAWAGAKQRHRWEGVAIGVGAAILGHTIVNSYQHNNRPHHSRGGGTVIVNSPPARVHHRPPRYHRQRYSPTPPSPPPSCGHWEVQRVWVAPVHEKVWNPGHYDANQSWVPGSWINVVKEEGYWKEERVWVSSR